MIFPHQRSRLRHLPEINVTSFIDVVLLLLIFFMLSTTFDRFGEVRIDLPKSGAAAASDPTPEGIGLNIDRDGRYFVNDQLVENPSLENLGRALRASLGDRQTLPVRISADRQSPYQALVTAMEAAAQAGLTQIGFVILQADPTALP